MINHNRLHQIEKTNFDTMDMLNKPHFLVYHLKGEVILWMLTGHWHEKIQIKETFKIRLDVGLMKPYS